MKKIKHFITSLLSAVSILAALLMVGVGYSDRLDPTDYPVLACAGMLFPAFVVLNIGILVFWLLVSWRRAMIPIVGLVLCYTPIRTFFPLHFNNDEVPDSALKVMSYNVCGYSGLKRVDHPVDSIVEYLRHEMPDIVCLQEDYRHNPDPFEQLKGVFPYNDTVHVNHNRSGEMNAVGIHSRFPIVRKEYIAYESKSNGSAAFFLLVDGDTVLVVNNHLESTHLSKDERQRYKEVLMGEMESELAKEEMHMIAGKLGVNMAIRAPQAEAVHRYIEEHSQYPIIVCGDFNDTPISYARQTIAQGMTDCFVSTGCGLGLSYNQKGFNLRIDHMMCSRHFKPYGCDIDNKMDASDHYPMICRLKMDDNH